MFYPIIRVKLEREYDALGRMVLPKLVTPEKLTFELFLWSFVMLLSRAARLTSKQGNQCTAYIARVG